MGKAREISTTHDIVKCILIDYPDTRNSDSLLFYMVYGHICNKKGINYQGMSIQSFFSLLGDNTFPSIETIRRTRQKIQADNPYLRANETVEGFRTQNQEIFRKYARQF